MLDEILQTRIMVKASMKRWKSDKVNNKSKKLNYNICRRNHIIPGWFSCRSSIQVELEFGNVGFCGGMEIKTENSARNPQNFARTNNKYNPHQYRNMSAFMFITINISIFLYYYYSTILLRETVFYNSES